MISQILVGLFVTTLLSLLVKPIFNAMTESYKPLAPSGFDANLWNDTIKRGNGGAWLGILECFFFYAMFVQEIHVAIAGWFGFKVAAKWEAWKNIVNFPSELKTEGISELDYLRARTQLGTWVMSKFSIGTLLNLFVGLIANLVSSPIVSFICSNA